MDKQKTELKEILKNFCIEGDVFRVKAYGDGLINQTYFVETLQEECPDYILQSKNNDIFKEIPGMMDNILKVTSHLKRKVIREGGDPDLEAIPAFT
jgi:hypothetical protein